MALKGLYTALVTPFANEAVELKDFKNLIKQQVNGGVDGVVVAGTTGESPILTEEEFITLIETAKAEAKQTDVFVGVGSCDTKKAVEKTKIAHGLGASGFLVVTPYYNKPTQSGLLEYYGRIADSTDRPIILYSVPSRTGVEIAIDTIVRLREKYSNIVAIKEASESCSRVETMVKIFGKDLVVFSGNDSMILPFMSLGAVGVVSVMSNVAPREMANLVKLASDGNFHGALKEYQTLMPIVGKLFIETNPLPIKFLLKSKNIISSAECRSPLGRLGEKSMAELANLVV
ncbi:MAG: 4-hydroxy-tetrahydrodipicolinate synthase [Puniceicoccales bacterium]|jgi:4-hydroxy-tetrahydrodipicolinate synthase|nr:4-hydroxy-tetrahydrodipicolinate synthase [Puniceicoccales bacterium]